MHYGSIVIGDICKDDLASFVLEERKTLNLHRIVNQDLAKEVFESGAIGAVGLAVVGDVQTGDALPECVLLDADAICVKPTYAYPDDNNRPLAQFLVEWDDANARRQSAIVIARSPEEATKHRSGNQGNVTVSYALGGDWSLFSWLPSHRDALCDRSQFVVAHDRRSAAGILSSHLDVDPRTIEQGDGLRKKDDAGPIFAATVAAEIGKTFVYGREKTNGPPTVTVKSTPVTVNPIVIITEENAPCPTSQQEKPASIQPE